MLSTSARSKPWYRGAKAFGRADSLMGTSCKVAGTLERNSAEMRPVGACEAYRLPGLSRRGGKRPEHGPRLGSAPGATGRPSVATSSGNRDVCKLRLCGRTGRGVSESGRCKLDRTRALPESDLHVHQQLFAPKSAHDVAAVFRPTAAALIDRFAEAGGGDAVADVTTPMADALFDTCRACSYCLLST